MYPSDGSIPVIWRGDATSRMLWLSAPVPHPISSQWAPWGSRARRQTRGRPTDSNDRHRARRQCHVPTCLSAEVVPWVSLSFWQESEHLQMAGQTLLVRQGSLVFLEHFTIANDPSPYFPDPHSHLSN